METTNNNLAQVMEEKLRKDLPQKIDEIIIKD
jgi:hypothetical protein